MHTVLAGKTKELDAAEQALQGIAVLDEDAEERLRASLLEAQEAAERKVAAVAEFEAAVAWLGVIDKLSAQLSDVAELQDSLTADEEAFESSRRQLKLAKAALELDADHRNLSHLRKAQRDDEEQLKANRERIDTTKLGVAEADAAVESAAQAAQQAKRARDEAAPSIRATRDLDTAIAERQKPILATKAKLTEQRAELGDLQAAASEAQQDLDSQAGALKVVQAELERTSVDEALIGAFAGIEARLGALGNLQDKLQGTRRGLREARDSAENARVAEAQVKRAVARSQSEADEAGQALKVAMDALDDALAGRTLAQLRVHRDDLSQRQKTLEDALAASNAVANATADLSTLAEQADEVAAAADKANDDWQALQDKDKALSVDVVRLEERVRLLRQIGSLEDERKNLQDGPSARSAEPSTTPMPAATSQSRARPRTNCGERRRPARTYSKRCRRSP